METTDEYILKLQQQGNDYKKHYEEFILGMQHKAKTKEFQNIKKELQEYVATNDLTKLTMLDVKYKVSTKELKLIQNGKLKISDLKVNTNIKIQTTMEHGHCGEKEEKETGSISLMTFAEYTLKMFDFIESGKKYDNCDDYIYDSAFEYIFVVPDIEHVILHELYTKYSSVTISGLNNYETFQNIILEEFAYGHRDC